jgi:hypothetical protein
MRPLPTRTRGGSLDGLIKQGIVHTTPEVWILMKAWLLVCLRPGFPFTVMPCSASKARRRGAPAARAGDSGKGEAEIQAFRHHSHAYADYGPRRRAAPVASDRT